jgi:hypothetical protein
VLSAAVVLRLTGGYLRRHGWWQGELFDLDRLAEPMPSTPAACTLGGIRMVTYGTPVIDVPDPVANQQFDQAVDALADYLVLSGIVPSPDPQDDQAYLSSLDLRASREQLVSDWNDAAERNLGQVLAAVYAAADDWDRLHPGLSDMGDEYDDTPELVPCGCPADLFEDLGHRAGCLALGGEG